MKSACLTGMIVLLSAAFTAFGGSSSQDENGIVPQYWYRFDGDTSSSGSLDWNLSFNAETTKYEASRAGQAFYGYAPYSNGAIDLGSGDWTVVDCAKITTSAENVIIWHIGSGKKNGLVLVGTGNGVRLVALSGGDGSTAGSASTMDESAQVSIPCCMDQYHSFAVKVSANVDGNAMARLYVDGVDTGATVECPFAQKPDMVRMQIGKLYDGGPAALKSELVVRHDDFRIYHQSLTPAQLAAIAAKFPVWPSDETGLLPHYWWKFDGDTAACGVVECGFKFWPDAHLFETSRVGQAIYNCGVYSEADLDVGGGDWTVVDCAKIASSVENSVVWHVGSGRANGIALMRSANGVKLVALSGGDGANDRSASNRVESAEASVADCETLYHTFAVTVTTNATGNATARLYIDGADTGVTLACPFAQKPDVVRLELNDYYRGGPDKQNLGGRHDEVRIYRQALSPGQTADIATALPVWPVPDANGMVPDYFMQFNGSFVQMGTLPATFTDETASYSAEGASSITNAAGMKSACGFTHATKAGCDLDLGGATGWTVMATVKAARDGDGRAVLFCLGDTASAGGAVYLAIAGGTLQLRHVAGADDDLLFSRSFSGATAFHHYALVCEGQATLRLYADGESVATVPQAMTQTTSPFRFGATVSDNEYCAFNGIESAGSMYDDWRLYRSALTAEQVYRIARQEFVIRRPGMFVIVN